MIRKLIFAWAGFCSIMPLAPPAWRLHAQREMSPAEEWAITGTAVNCGNVYQDIPDKRVTTPAAARSNDPIGLLYLNAGSGTRALTSVLECCDAISRP